MTNYYTKKGNRIIKYAYLSFIRDFMIAHAIAIVHTDEGYDQESDMIHFVLNGEKCTLLNVRCPSPEDDIIPLTVKVGGVVADVYLQMRDIRIGTLERIAEEIHSLLWIPEKDGEWETYKQGYISDFLDTYLAR